MTGDILGAFGLRSDGIPADHLDAGLLRAIRLAADLEQQRDDAYANWNARPSRRRGTKKEAGQVFFEIHETYKAAEDEVIRTRAVTVDGARAKLRYVLSSSEYETDAEERPRGGTMTCLPRSAMRDALAMLGEG